MKTTRRTFLKLGALIGLVPAITEAKPDKLLCWRAIACESGTTAYENVKLAKRMAAEIGLEIRFSFNYHTFYCVHPNGDVEVGYDQMATPIRK